MAEDYSNKDYFWIPIHWDVADYLIKNYSQDWEGISPNGIDLDAWIKTLEDCSQKHARIHFPHLPLPPLKEGEEEEF
jgi:hypothetical protein